MELRPFGKTGLRVAPIGLGGYPFGGRQVSAGWDPWTPEGRQRAIATVQRALERGINYIDTAPSYGDGKSEDILGEALAGQRDRIVLATKCGYRGLSADQVTESVHQSLRRLRTDHADVVQFHGGIYEPSDTEHILKGGPLDALRKLREQGKVRWIGFTTEEPYSGMALLQSGAFDMVQLCYNLIYQGAALHALPAAQERGVGVAVMRPMTSGIFQNLARSLAPEWQAARDLYRTALLFILSDPRVHVANVGVRSPAEVDRNVDLAESSAPPLNVAELPRSTAGTYREADEREKKVSE